jgi:V8-like Glu-specific endopeptidase
VPAVGALFYGGGGRKGHFCTASVVDSAAGDLVVTAAHCVYSKAHGYSGHIEFIPGYHDGKRPYGTWAVRKITVAGGWRRSQNPDLDVAFLAVGSPHGTRIQSRTGGLRLGTGKPYSEAVVPAGYNDTDRRPVECRTKSFRFRPGQMGFYCRGFRDGTSGGPWIAGFNPRTGTGTITGVIGGYEQGGDYDWASYSPYFGPAVQSLFRQAGGVSPKPKPKKTPSKKKTRGAKAPRAGASIRLAAQPVRGTRSAKAPEARASGDPRLPGRRGAKAPSARASRLPAAGTRPSSGSAKATSRQRVRVQAAIAGPGPAAAAPPDAAAIALGSLSLTVLPPT